MGYFTVKYSSELSTWRFEDSKKGEGLPAIPKDVIEKALSSLPKNVLDPNKTHTIRVRKVGEENFSVQLGSGKEIYIKKAATGAGGVEDSYIFSFQKKSWSSLPGVWYMVRNFFRDRFTSHEKKGALAQLHSIVKGFSYADVIVEDKVVKQKVEHVIAAGKSVENVLRGKATLDATIKEFVGKCDSESWSCPCVLPLGNNRYMPIFITVTKKEAGYSISMYFHTPDAAAMGQPEVQGTVNKGDLAQFLTNVFTPMVSSAQQERVVSEVTMSDPVLEKLVEEMLKEQSDKLPKPVSVAPKEKEVFVDSDALVIKGYFSSLGLVDVQRPKQVSRVRMAQTAPEIMLQWLSSIEGSSVTPEKATGMLCSLTKRLIRSELKTITPTTSTIEKIDIYDKVLAHIDRLQGQLREFSMEIDPDLVAIKREIERKKQSATKGHASAAIPFFRKKFSTKVLYGSVSVTPEPLSSAAVLPEVKSASGSPVSVSYKSVDSMVKAFTPETIHSVVISDSPKYEDDTGKWLERHSGLGYEIKTRGKKDLSGNELQFNQNILDFILDPSKIPSKDKVIYERLIYGLQEAAFAPPGTKVMLNGIQTIVLSKEQRKEWQNFFALRSSSRESEKPVLAVDKQSMVDAVSSATREIDDTLKKIRAVQNLDDKRTLLIEMRSKLFAVIDVLPCPGEGILRGERSFFDCLSSDQQTQMHESIENLQNMIYEVQLNLMPDTLQGPSLKTLLKGYFLLNELSLLIGKWMTEEFQANKEFSAILKENLLHGLGRSFSDRFEVISMMRFLRMLERRGTTDDRPIEERKHQVCIRALIDPEYTIFEETESGSLNMELPKEFFLRTTDPMRFEKFSQEEGMIEVSASSKKLKLFLCGQMERPVAKRFERERQLAVYQRVEPTTARIPTYMCTEEKLDQYIDALVAEGQLPDVPIPLVKQLFQIRRVDLSYEGEYSGEMIFSAFNFICDEKNIQYLSNPYVQTFLQQTLLDCPNLLRYIWCSSASLKKYIGIIQNLLEKESISPEVGSFLKKVLVVFKENVDNINTLVERYGQATVACFTRSGTSLIHELETGDLFEQRKKDLVSFKEIFEDVKPEKLEWDPKRMEKTPEQKELFYITYLESLRHASFDGTKATDEDYAHILEAVSFLSQCVDIAVSPSAVQYELMYVRNQYIKGFEALEVDRKKSIFQQLLPKGEAIRSVTKSSSPGTYVITTAENAYEWNVHTFMGTLSGQYFGPLPEETMDLLSKAHVAIPKKVRGTKVPSGMEYRWTDSQGSFVVKVLAKKWSIHRQIDGQMYQFSPVAGALDFGSVSKMLRDFGVWINEADRKKGRVFSSSQFDVQLDSDGKIVEMTKGNFAVVTDPAILPPFPWLQKIPCLILVDKETGRCAQIECEAFPLRVQKTGDRFEVFYEGKSFGMIRESTKEDRRCDAFFGKMNTDRILIPVDGPMQYILLPFPLHADVGQKMVTVRTDRPTVPCRLLINEDGSISGSAQAVAYLTLGAAQQAALLPGTKRVVEVSILLQQLMKKTIPTNMQERQQLLQVFSALRQEVQKQLAPDMDPKLLSIYLKFLIFVEKLPVLERSGGLFRDVRTIIQDREDIAVAYALYSKIAPKFNTTLTPEELDFLRLLQQQVLLEVVDDPGKCKKFLERLPTDVPFSLAMPREGFSSKAFVSVVTNAKPPAPSFSVDLKKGPFTADFLIQNFFYILQKIQEEVQKDPPPSYSDFASLFLPALVDPYLNPEEKIALQKTEQYLRKLLLGFVAIELNVKMMSTKAKKELDVVKKSFEFSDDQKENFQKLGIQGEIDSLVASIAILEIPKEFTTKSLSELIKKMTEAQSAMLALGTKIKEKLTTAEADLKEMEELQKEYTEDKAATLKGKYPTISQDTVMVFVETQKSVVVELKKCSEEFSKKVSQFEEKKKMFENQKTLFEQRETVLGTLRNLPDGLGHLDGIQFSTDPVVLKTLLDIIKNPPRTFLEKISLVRSLGVQSSISALRVQQKSQTLIDLASLFGYLAIAPGLAGIEEVFTEKPASKESLLRLQKELSEKTPFSGEESGRILAQVQGLVASGRISEDQVHALSSYAEGLDSARTKVQIQYVRHQLDQSYEKLKSWAVGRSTFSVSSFTVPDSDKIEIPSSTKSWVTIDDSMATTLYTALRGKSSWADFKKGLGDAQLKKTPLSLLLVIKKTFRFRSDNSD